MWIAAGSPQRLVIFVAVHFHGQYSGRGRFTSWLGLPADAHHTDLCSCDVGQFRNEEVLGSLALDGFTPPIVALSRGHVGMTRQSLDGGDISAGVQQIAGGNSPQALHVIYR